MCGAFSLKCFCVNPCSKHLAVWSSSSRLQDCAGASTITMYLAGASFRACATSVMRWVQGTMATWAVDYWTLVTARVHSNSTSTSTVPSQSQHCYYVISGLLALKPHTRTPAHQALTNDWVQGRPHTHHHLGMNEQYFPAKKGWGLASGLRTHKFQTWQQEFTTNHHLWLPILCWMT